MEREERTAASHEYLRLHLREPDFSRPPLAVPPEQEGRLMSLLTFLYGEEKAASWYPELERLMRVYHAHKTDEMIAEDAALDPAERLTERDVVLITYGDLLKRPGERPLRSLARVLETNATHFSTLHILPFFPYSSDRGFSVISFREVDPQLGSWEDIEALALKYQLMFDGAINHVSSKSRWFQEYLAGNPEFADHFIGFSTSEAISPDHLKLILRPRTTPLLTPFQTLDGQRHVWTTFSPDQVDLNYKNPKVLMRVVAVLLDYVRRGADLIRLDAATYLWRELGTNCAHLAHTHKLIQVFRAVLDVVAPRVALVTETNVPHEDNVSYFGDGTNEAQMVYNFSLPPLVLHTFQTGDCSHLTRWAATLRAPSPQATFFNFLDSHDGVGLLGAKGVLPPEAIDAMVRRAEERGGLVSYRTDQDGGRSPYELNITWWSALNPRSATENRSLRVDRFMASRAVAMALAGVPGIYIASMVGGRNDREAVMRTGEARAINRWTLDADQLVKLLENPLTAGSMIFRRMERLLGVRVHTPAFHPNGAQRVLPASDRVFAVVRRAPGGAQTILALTNVTAEPQEVTVRREEVGEGWARRWRDLLSDTRFEAEGDALEVRLPPYLVCWLEAQG